MSDQSGKGYLKNEGYWIPVWDWSSTLIISAGNDLSWDTDPVLLRSQMAWLKTEGCTLLTLRDNVWLHT